MISIPLQCIGISTKITSNKTISTLNKSLFRVQIYKRKLLFERFQYAPCLWDLYIGWDDLFWNEPKIKMYILTAQYISDKRFKNGLGVKAFIS